MNALLRSAMVVVVIAPLAVCVFCLRFACDSTDLRRIMRELRLNEEQEQLRRATFRRIEAREELVREVIAQRCSLKDALAHFQEMDREWPAYATEVSKIDGWISYDAEYYYRYILAIAEGVLQDRPEEAAALLRRLEQDYQQLQTTPKLTEKAAPRP